jgi:hypothetical protein
VKTMKCISILVLSVMLGSAVSLAEPMPQPVLEAPTPIAPKKDKRLELFKEWWLWSLVATLAAGTVVTSVVLAARPGGSLSSESQDVALTVRF